MLPLVVEAGEQLAQEGEGLAAGHRHPPLPLGLLGVAEQGAPEVSGQEVLAQRGVGEGERVVVPAHEEGRRAQVFLPHVGGARRVVQGEIAPGVHELQ